MPIVCNIYKTVGKIGVKKDLVERAVRAVCTQERITNGEVSIHFIGDARMRSLNNLHRGKDRTTDVLSFAAGEGFGVPGGVRDIGDIFLCVPQITRQAKEHNISYKEECLRMLIHGTLHALGYDHIKKTDAAVMFPLQERLLRNVLS